MQQQNHFSFWDFIQQHRISIPIIQRDYAQGRTQPEVRQIREELLKNIHSAISGGPKLYFDFIYGSQEGNVYIPLDGQQRLTTLFLLHWYFAVKDSKLDTTVKEILNRFTYETRTTSADFCRALVTEDFLGTYIVGLPLHKMALSESLKDCSWFFMAWKRDPTIQAMLVMLDNIHDVFSSVDDGFDKLIDNDDPCISFHSLLLENFGLTDTLYIKMNSRGKPLTEFEVFKARLERVIDQILPTRKKEFFDKIDGDWTDLFWCYKDSKTFLFDRELMNFFRFIATTRYALKSEESESVKVIENRLANPLVSIPFPVYIELGCFDNKAVEDVINTLDILKKGQSGVKTLIPAGKLTIHEEKLFKDLISFNHDFTYASRIQFYAVTQFVIRNGSCPEELVNWMRVVRNLTENTFYNSADIYIRDIRAIEMLLPHSMTILEYLKNPENALNGFAVVQREEERVKASLMLKGDRWSELISKFENHGYFNGQIGFALSFAGILSGYKADPGLNWNENEENEFFSRFLDYQSKMTLIFDKAGLRKFPKFLWERALLAKGNYLLTKGRNLHFADNADRDLSWKRLLRGGTTFEEKRMVVKKLLDDFSDIEDVGKSLEAVIARSALDATIEPWRMHFIRDGGMIEACHQRYIRWFSPNNILLLQTTQTNGTHRECFTYSLSLLLEVRGNEVLYMPAASVDYPKYIYSINDEPVEIYYGYYNTAWQYRVKDSEADVMLVTEDEVLEYLDVKNYLVKHPGSLPRAITAKAKGETT